jgi:hypothetical protein
LRDEFTFTSLPPHSRLKAALDAALAVIKLPVDNIPPLD